MVTPLSPEQAKAVKLAERHTKATLKMTNREVRRMKKLVEDARQDVIVMMNEAKDKSFTQAYYREYLPRIEERLIDLNARLTGDQMQTAIVAQAQDGVVEVGKYLEMYEMPFSPTLPMEVVESSYFMTADMVSNVTLEQGGRIRHIMQRGMLAKAPTREIMRQVAAKLKDKGPFRDIALRSEAIVRTEHARVYNSSKMSSMNRFAKSRDRKPGKMWISAPDDDRNRSEHLAAHKTIVPYDQPFIVMGEKLMYPLDPRGSAKNTVFCRCTFATVFGKKTKTQPSLPDEYDDITEEGKVE